MKGIIIMVCKGILLYTTIIASIIFLMGADDLFDKGYLFWVFIILMLLIFTCYKCLTKKDIDTLLFVSTEKDIW